MNNRPQLGAKMYQRMISNTPISEHEKAFQDAIMYGTGYMKHVPYVEALGQSKKHSIIESIVNVLVGFGIATVANMLVMPLFGYNVTLHDSAGIGGILTIVSIARSYCLRRVFNWLHLKGL